MHYSSFAPLVLAIALLGCTSGPATEDGGTGPADTGVGAADTGGNAPDAGSTASTALDFGDAPAPTLPTLLASNGARHGLGSGVYLGACVDAEDDGQPSATANGDDLASGAPIFGTCAGGDDEDGVAFTSSLFVGAAATVNVTASAGCTLSAWIDFNADGDWGDAGENLFPGGQVLVGGVNGLTFTVPAAATAGTTHARFRCTTAGAVTTTGLAPDGEVEDYQVTITTAMDLGDAPDPTWPTLLASNGASHLLGSGVYLGTCVDAEANGQPTVLARGDDFGVGMAVFGTCVGSDDEDGVIFTNALDLGTTATVNVTANAACTLSAWIDFNRDGDWSDAGEDLFPGGQALLGGLNGLSFAVPAAATVGITYARFRCTTAGAVAATGLAPDGEVEDYQVTIGTALAFGDAPNPSFPTLLEE